MVSRRHVLKMLTLAGCAAGVSQFRPLWAMASADSPVSGLGPRTMTETRLLMGTFVSVTLADNSQDRMREGLELAFSRMNEHIAVFNRFDSASPISALNAQGSLHDAPPALCALLERSLAFGRLTRDAFNVTVQPLVDLFRLHQNPTGTMQISDAEWKEAASLVMSDGVKVSGRAVSLARSGMGVTLDGIAKGHIADEVSAYLTSLGLCNHIINAGGDIVAQGEKAPGQPWMVAVRNPADTLSGSGAVARQASRQGRGIPLSGRAIATSGSYEIFYDASRRHHHLINPAAGQSPTDVVSVSVTAKTALEADALATAFSVMPPRDALRLVSALPGRECLLLTATGQAMKSAGWPA